VGVKFRRAATDLFAVLALLHDRTSALGSLDIIIVVIDIVNQYRCGQ
jgi:hypothetical protein